MVTHDSQRDEYVQRFYLGPAAAWIRATRPELGAGSDATVVGRALAAGVRLQRYKRARPLPRVRRILGMLQSMQPTSLLDIGSGRGAFLWPLLEAFPQLPVTAIDAAPERARQLQAVSQGGMTLLQAHCLDATSLPFEDKSFAVVTALEVLEHVVEVRTAVREIVRVARDFVLITVPSQADNNPEHIHLLTGAWLKQALSEAGATRVAIEGVLNHLVVTARIPGAG